MTMKLQGLSQACVCWIFIGYWYNSELSPGQPLNNYLLPDKRMKNYPTESPVGLKEQSKWG